MDEFHSVKPNIYYNQSKSMQKRTAKADLRTVWGPFCYAQKNVHGGEVYFDQKRGIAHSTGGFYHGNL